MDQNDQQQVLDDLLTQWEDRVARGEHLSTEELCANHPELFGEVQRHVRALQSFASRFGIESDDVSLSQSSTDDHATELPVRSIRIEAEYQLERLHGVGGLGSVYLAHDPQLNRRVAIKFPRGKRHSAVSRLRFEREARITSRLDHPGIVPVHVIHTDSKGQPCYAMRFIEGDTLQVAIDRFHREKSVERFRGPEFRDLLRRFQVVCEIAAYAHSQGIIHRDIKPSNIMLGPFGETLLVDWGLAKIMKQADDVPALNVHDELPPSATSATATQSGQIIGTPAFASPEQLIGQSRQVDGCSDVFSLGATMFCLLTGEHLLQSCELPDHLKRIQRNQLPRPRDRNASVQIPLDAICRRALSVNPADRYCSPQELSRDIERFLSDEPISIPCETMWVRSARWLRKHSTLAASTLVLILVGFSAAIASSLVLKDKNTQLSTAVNELRVTNRYLTDMSYTLGIKESADGFRENQAATATATSAQVLKALISLSDQVTSVFPNRTEVYTDADLPLLRTLRERYLGIATIDALATERLHIRAIGHLHAGGLSLCLEDLDTAETQLKAAKQDLLILQVVSLVDIADECLARCCALLGECRRASGRRDLAILDYQEALARFDKLLAKKSRDLSPNKLLHRTDALIALTELQIDQLDTAAQAEQFRATIGVLLERFKNDERQIDTGIMLVRALETEALLRAEVTAMEESRNLLTQACEICDTLLKVDPQQLRVRTLFAKCLQELAQQLLKSENVDSRAERSSEAMAALSKAVRIQRGLVAECPSHKPFREALIDVLKLRANVRQRLELLDLAAVDLELSELLKDEEVPTPVVRLAEFTGLTSELLRIRNGRLSDDLPATEFLLQILIPKLREAIRDPQEGRFFLRMFAEALMMIDAELKSRSKRYAEADVLLAEGITVVTSHAQDRRAKLMFSLVFHELNAQRAAVLNHMERIDEAKQLLAAAGSFQEESEPAPTESTRPDSIPNVPSEGITSLEAMTSLTPDEVRDLAGLQRESLLLSLSQLKKQYVAADRVPDAIVIWERQQQLLRMTRDQQFHSLTFPEPDQGLSPLHWIYRNDNIVYVEVQSTLFGSVWGTGPYSDDSDIGTAAVHSGELKPGEVKFVAIRFLPAPSKFAGSTAHGVTSNEYSGFSGCYEILGSGIRGGQFLSYPREPGVRFVNVVVDGTTDGQVWGTDIYAAGSHISTAAVHCGLLKPGEAGLIKVELLPGRDEYEPSIRNGITSQFYESWPESIRLHRLH